jgi:hypothetical protein
MDLWNGYDKKRNERTRYDVNGSRFTYYIDESGSIFYTDSEAPTEPPRVWCPASMLTTHLKRLYQIKNR